MPDEPDDKLLDENLSRLLRSGADLPKLDPARRAEMLHALRAAQARTQQAKEGTMTRPSHRFRRFVWVAAAAAGVAAAALLIHALSPKQPPYVAPGVRWEGSEASGQVIRKTLSDGTILLARPGTEFYEHPGGRRLRLSRGELYLIVARADRPFVVETRHGKATAKGTRFAIALQAATRVAVAQGTVALANAEGEVVVSSGEEGFMPSDEKPHRAPAPRVSYLVSWAREALAQAERLVPKEKRDTGQLVAVDPWGQEVNLSLRKYHVDIYIENGIARVTVDQTFFNHMPWQIEGTFYFPLPPDASVSRLAMYVNGTLNEGGMVERSRGQEIYTEIKFQRRDPALLEMMEGNVFKMRIFPIEGRQEKRLFLSYTQKLSELYGTLRYWFPMDHSQGNARELAIHARIKGGAGLYAPHSSTHPLAVKEDSGDLLLDYKAADVAPNQDFLLHLVPSQEAPREAFATTAKDGQTYVFARVAPKLPGEVKPAPRQWIVLNDVSASRAKLDIQAQAYILTRLVEEADDFDRIALINLNTRAERQRPGLLSVRDPDARRLAEAAQVRVPLGGTNLAVALEAAANLIAKDSLRNPHILYLGDGVATDGKASVDELLNRLPKGATFVGIGVGKKADAAFLQAAADQTGGLFALINPDEDIDWRVFDLVAALNTPRLVGLTAEFQDASGKPADILAYPSARALADGETLFVVGRTSAAAPVSLVLRGKVGEGDFERRYSLAGASTAAEFIPRLWAKRHIDELLKSGPEHKDEVVALSKQYYVMTPFTSLIVLENDAMYEQYKVERGRKDHWALYPAPKTIPVVQEPVDWSRWSWWGYASEDAKVKAKAEPKTIQDIVESVQFRVNAPFYYWRPQRDDQGRFALYGLLGGKADPTRFVTVLLNLAPEKGEKAEAAPQTGEQSLPARLPATFNRRVSRSEFVPPVLATTPDVNGDGWFARSSWSLELGYQVPVELSISGQLLNGGTLSLFTDVERLGDLRSQLSAAPVLRMFDYSDVVTHRGMRLGIDMDGKGQAPLDMAFKRGGWGISAGELSVSSTLVGYAYNYAAPDRGGLDLPPQVSFGLEKALSARFDRIGRDIRSFNARYSGYSGDDWGGWGYRGGLDLTRSLHGKRLGDLGRFAFGDALEEDPDVPIEDIPVSSEPLEVHRSNGADARWLRHELRQPLVLASFARALKTVPGATAALAADYLVPRRDELLKKKLSDAEAKELAAIQAALASLPDAATRFEDAGIFWSWQGWNYRPQPWVFQPPQVQAHPRHNWAFDLTRYAPGLYSTTSDIVGLVEEEYGTPPGGKVAAEAAEAIAAARAAILPVRVRFGKDGPAILAASGDRFAITRKTEMRLEERMLCDGESVCHLYAELGLAARRKATPLRRAALRQLAPHLVEPADWLSRSYNVELAEKKAGRFTLKLSPIMAPEQGKEPPKPSFHILLAVSPDGRILEKTLFAKGKAALRLAYTYEGPKVAAKWSNAEGKELASADFQAEPFTPDPDTFKADLAPHVVLDMPLRRPSYYEAQLEKLKDAKTAQTVALKRHLALAQIQELNWRRWGGANEQARKAITDALNDLYAIGAKAKLGDLALLGSCGYWHELTDPRSLRRADKTDVPADHPLFGYFACFGSNNAQELARLRDRCPDSLLGHLAAYHAAVANYQMTQDFDAFLAQYPDSPLVLAAAHFAGNWGNNPQPWLKLLDLPRWRTLAILMSTNPAKNDAVQSRVAEAFAKLHKELSDKGCEVPISSYLETVLRQADGGKHWQSVIRGALKVAIESDRVGPLLRFAELAMRNGESEMADAALARARKLARDDGSLVTKLALAQTCWAGGRAKDALKLHDEVIAALEAKGLPPSACLLAATARLAQQAGETARAIELEERSLAIEHQHLPEMINIQAFRQRYGWLWGQYQAMVSNAARAKDERAVDDAIVRAAQAFARCCDVDREAPAIYQQMATLEAMAGHNDGAWLYLSSIIDQRPKDAQTYHIVGQWYLGRSDPEQAQHWYARAAECDTANPQWLLQRAQVLDQMGRRDDARGLYQQIIQGKWAPGLQGYVDQAKKRLEK